jgi:purine-binding chemotaxis protein CheW
MNEQNLDPNLSESEYNNYSALLHEMQSFLSAETSEESASSANAVLDETLNSTNSENIANSIDSMVFEQVSEPTFVFEQLTSFVEAQNSRTNLESNDSLSVSSQNLSDASNFSAPDNLAFSSESPIYDLASENRPSQNNFADENQDGKSAADAVSEQTTDKYESTADLDDFENFNSLPLLLMKPEVELPLPNFALDDEPAAIVEDVPLGEAQMAANTASSTSFSSNASGETIAKQASAATISKPIRAAIPLDLHERYIVFRLDDEFYAFSAANIAEIGHPLSVTLVPFVPVWFLGIANLRGDILSVIGLREFWNKKAIVQQKAKMLILRSRKNSLTIGVIVDGVREMRRVPTEEIHSIDDNSEDQINFYKIGTADYDGHQLHILDAEQLLASLKV